MVRPSGIKFRVIQPGEEPGPADKLAEGEENRNG